MKLTKIIIAVLYLSYFQAISQTNIGGTLRTDLTFTKAGSPYFITTNLGVPQGRTLTIEPGATVNFDNASQIIIQGRLVANGTQQDTIVFNGNVKGNAMLQFQKTNLDSNLVSFARFNGPKDGIKINYFNTDPNRGSLVLNNLELFNSKIENNSDLTTLLVNYSHISNSQILSYSRSRSIRIIGCKIDSSQVSINPFFHSTYIDSSIVSSSKIVMNRSVDSMFNYSAYLNINNSNFANTLINLPVSYAGITYSKFSFDSNYTQTSGIIFGYGKIGASVLKGNGKMIGIERGYTNFTIENTYPFEIDNCSFINFETNIKLNGSDNRRLISSSGNVQDGKGGGSGAVLIHRCNFLDEPKNYFIQNLSIYDISTSLNWWSTTDISVIDSKIYDYWDDILYGEVIYKNNLEEPAVVGIKPSEVFKSTIIISPNPFSNETFIENTNSFNGWTMNLLDAAGSEVKNATNLNGYKIKLSRENLKAGMYFLRLSNEKGNSITNKIIITD